MAWEVVTLVIAAVTAGRVTEQLVRLIAKKIGRSPAEAERALASGGFSLLTEPHDDTKQESGRAPVGA